MIITEEGRVYVAVGDVVHFMHSDYVCVVDPIGNKYGGCKRCAFCKKRPCNILECCGGYRYDGEYVYFELLSKQEGGEDDNQ